MIARSLARCRRGVWRCSHQRESIERFCFLRRHAHASTDEVAIGPGARDIATGPACAWLVLLASWLALAARRTTAAVQSRHPPDPVGQLLPLPRSGQEPPRGGPAAGHPRRSDRGKGHRARQAGRERIGAPGSTATTPDVLMPPPESHKTLTAAAEGVAQALDRRRRGVPGALGLRAARQARHAGRHRTASMTWSASGWARPGCSPRPRPIGARWPAGCTST